MNDASQSPRQLTLRAVATGAVLGALLVPCNVYSGLKIGWSFNMSIAAALLSYGFWGAARRSIGPHRIEHWGLLENNINQTCASSAASIISAGLVAPIPALTILTGTTLSWPVLSVWLFTVSCIGVLVGLALRRQMLEVQQLPFPSGIATAETVREIYAEGREAVLRVRYLLGAGVASAATKIARDVLARWEMINFTSWGPAIGLGAFNLPTLTTRNLGFVFEPSFLMVGFGAIVGLRVGASLLLGAVVAWGILAPWLFATGRLPLPDGSDGFVVETALSFLLWPGVAMMVTAALVSFSFSIPGIVLSFLRRGQAGEQDQQLDPRWVGQSRRGVPARVLILGLVLATIGTTLAQTLIFGIEPHMGVLAVALTLVLAVVSARVSGETGIPPIGALGKITQLTFGTLNPTNVTENLMTANVTGGAADQCSDLLHDLKTGRLLGASVSAQGAAQFLGVLTGSLAGSAAYLVLVPDPAGMLLTPEWPAPAVATWKAVAELFRDGISESMPPGALVASVTAAAVGAILAVLNSVLPKRWAQWLPSPVSLGLAFVIPAWNSISLFLGALVAAVAMRVMPGYARRFTLPIAAGLVAGESLAGVASALVTLVSGN